MQGQCKYRKVVISSRRIYFGCVQLSDRCTRMAANFPRRHRGHEARVDVGDRHLCGGMHFQ
ncbi:Uncharacterised protein [Mycobacteroides abscessus subsp. abscessus]|nr:Uncharacterised protein [Mycobacteroides abscessus subsp. abscessus]